jgi:DNA-binding IclR family transcriptional regulator
MQPAENFPSPPAYSTLPQYPIESVDNALRLLFLIGEQRTLRLTDASHYLEVASSTAHRLLAMLVYRGFIKQDPVTRAYEAGPSLDRIATSVLRRLDIREQARPVLERLNADVGETVHLGRLEGNAVHFIDSIESQRAVRVGSRLGRFMPAHCTSTGKSLLARLEDTELRLLYPDEKLEQLTPRSIGTFPALMAELAKVRKNGFATSIEESEDGVTSTAVALDVRTSLPMAVNVSAPTSRTTAAVRKTQLAALRAAVAEIESLDL